MFKRDIVSYAQEVATRYPVVTIVGPRQAGKTTVARAAFPKKSYVSLETPDQREFAQKDPKRFLAQYPDGAILDEIQRVPNLVSYIQTIVDEHPGHGRFILTGSHNFLLRNSVNQSLAGRTAIVQLLPLALSEISELAKSWSLEDAIFHGGYPRVLAESLPPTEAYANYFATYVERDLRELAAIKDLATFQRFVRLCAGRIGQPLNLSGLGNEAGVSHTTAREWLSLLEASYIVFLLPPHHRNFNKRITKSPKLYFCDVGLASHLLGISMPQQLTRDPARGHLFENLAVLEMLKSCWNSGKTFHFSFFADSAAREVDLLMNYGQYIVPIEIKAGTTVIADFFKGLDWFCTLRPDDMVHPALVYGGASASQRQNYHITPFLQCKKLYQDAEQAIAQRIGSLSA